MFIQKRYVATNFTHDQKLSTLLVMAAHILYFIETKAFAFVSIKNVSCYS